MNQQDLLNPVLVMMRRSIALCLLVIPAALSAQEGRITFSYAVQYDFEVPEQWKEMQIPTASNTEMVLLFNASESVMSPVGAEEGPTRPSERNRRLEGAMARLKMGSASRGDQETLLETYTDFERDAVSETRELIGRTFLIAGPRPKYRWTLGSEQRAFMGYMVQKATTEHEGSVIEAWFTPHIPVPAGPGPFGGLPGMILVLTIDAGKTVYSATEIDVSGLGERVIAAPNEGDMVTREEYEQIVAEKLEEIETLRGRGGDRRRPFK